MPGSDVRYCTTEDGVHIAYRIFGEGPRDIVLIPGTTSHVEFYWEFPPNAYILTRLTSFARVIVFDKRGQGLSDRVVAEQTLEERIGDVRAVMDAAGSERATICGWSEGGSMSLMFSATYPERTSALVVFGSYASLQAEPAAVSPEVFEQVLDGLEKGWGQGVSVALNAPSRVNDEAFVRWFAQAERAAASPGAIVALMRANYQIDVRHVLPSIHAPTLILHRVGDALVPVECGRYLAEHIPGARYVELPGDDHLVQAYDQEVLDTLLDEIEEFITGTRQSSEPDRALATLMVSSVVDSGAAEHGAPADFHAMVRKQLDIFRGREANTIGDNVLAIFDGPARAIRCAAAIRDRATLSGVEVRTGLHTGECELDGADLGGLAVDIAASVAAMAGPGEVLISRTVRDLVAGSGLNFTDRGTYRLEGLPDDWQLYALQSATASEPAPARPASAYVTMAAPTRVQSFASGRYVITRVLGEGGQKIVYLARDTELARDVAIALVKAEGMAEAGLTRMRREAQSLARLEAQPNIVAIYDIGSHDGRPYTVCEYVGGGTLEDELARAGGPLPPERATAITRDVCHALIVAHGAGIIHRDIKPSNIWLTAGGSAKLGDFGLATALDLSRVTQAGTVFGTAAYMAPEQALGQQVDARCDIYSLGCVLYEMLAGRAPFRADSAVGVIGQHLNVAPGPLPAGAVSRPLEALVLRMLAKAPEDRPSSASDVLGQLNQAGV